ncbi:MAG TPA: cytochrome c-type biogenesis protein [Burkholderiales bacterium]|jgi:cytochrome c-type biogenesis protein CcmH|nr:cytochrome c-type biogenesis protein [Burkholderiales bacterium]
MKWLAALWVVCSVAVAGEPPSALDPQLERRLARVASELRCLVCQNQSLAESNADLAVDLRNQVREMIKAGRSDEEIRAFMVQRYGDFVLYKPPLKNTTLLLWAGPFVLLVLGAAAAALYLRRRARRMEDEGELSEQERARARALLSAERETSK